MVPDWVYERLPGTLGAVVSGVVPPLPYTSSSESCPAGQPLLAVMVIRT